MKRKKPRWWSYMRRCVRDYPGLKQEYEELHRQSLSADISGMPKGSAAGRTVESIALRELHPDDQSDYDAVTQAIMITKRQKNGETRLELIRYIYWYEKEHRVKDAAPVLYISESTARRWHGEFIKLVAKIMGKHPY